MSRFNGPPPRMGATYTPGLDDYNPPLSPPPVVSPLPQRFTPEVPGQIQDSLANLEINGGRVDSRSPALIQSPTQISRAFSPLPKIAHRTSNIPPSSEELEATLEAARSHVLQSTDPEMQLAWAQDTLTHVEICSENASRISATGNARPATPPIQHQLRTDAVNIVSFLADQQHPRADFIRGSWLEFGRFGFPLDKPEAFRCYKRAASKGYARAQYRMGLQYESTGESIKALQHYKAGEALGDAASCYRMGMMSLSGQLGQVQDYATAIRLIRQAADSADENAPQGSYVLGMLQARELAEIKVPEDLLPFDPAAAKIYVEKAAFLGFATAQLKMGVAYEMCLFGCDFDPVLSMHYNALAAMQGEPEAEMALSKWYLCGHEGSFAKNEQVAFTYAQRAASSGLPTAQFAMGYFYEIGLTVQPNLTTARQWYEKAAANGNSDARGRLSAIAKSQTLSRQDHENVAVSRIKSQYGSRRGGYPPRGASRPPQGMPSIPDGAAYSPRPPPQQQIPPNGRITPYPVDDRPTSAATYPAPSYPDQRQRPPPQAAYLGAEQRPSSAAADARNNQQPRPPQGYLSPNPQDRLPQMPLPRPNTTTANPNAGPPGYRQPSQPMAQGRPPPQNYGAPSPQPQQRPYASASPKVDIGFSAPADARADQRNRPPMGPTAHQQRLAPGLAPNAGAPPARQPSPAAPGRTNRPPAQNYSMSGALPVSSSSSSGAPATGKPVAPASKPAAKPAAQTFEQMGVPQGKSDHDCAVM